MPTINQLVRKSRHDKVRKSKSPVLGIGLNSIQKKRKSRKKIDNKVVSGGLSIYN